MAAIDWPTVIALGDYDRYDDGEFGGMKIEIGRAHV
jgi:hypothetical protein